MQQFFDYVLRIQHEGDFYSKSIQNFEALNDRIEEIAATFKNLDAALSKYSDNARLIQTIDVANLMGNQILAENIPEEKASLYSNGFQVTNGTEHTLMRQDDKTSSNTNGTKVANSLEGLSSLSENTLGLAAAFGKLPPKLEGLKNVLGYISDVTDRSASISKLFSTDLFSATGGLLAGGMIAASEIIAVATVFAESTAVLGPAGWVAGLSAMLIGGAATAIINGGDDGKVHYRDNTAANWRKFYEEKIRQEDYEKLISLYGVRSYNQLAKVEAELDSDYMIDSRRKRVDIELSKTPASFSDYSKKWRSSASPTSALSKTNSKSSNFDYSIPNAAKKAQEIEQTKKLAAFDSMGGPIDIKRLNRDVAAIEARYKLKKPIKEPMYRIPTEQEWEKSRRADLNLPEPPKEKRHGGQTRRQPTSLVAGARIININLNKPMIEHFTIHVAEMKEGLGNFRQKVEEILLEILNSANAI